MAPPMSRIQLLYMNAITMMSIASAASLSPIPRMPPGAWDAHIHIVDPTRYALEDSATYTPSPVTAWDNVMFENSIGCAHNTIIQPSIYGFDNTAVLDALRAYGPDRSRAVVQFDPNTTTAAQLQEWHELGVRGVRINVVLEDETPPASEVQSLIKAYVDAVGTPFDWVIQLNVPMAMIGELEPFLSTLRSRICFDHFGKPDVPPTGGNINPYDVKGFSSLINLLQGNSTWVKISGPYTISKSGGPLYEDLDPFALEMFRLAPKRVVFGSDWPHVTDEGVDIRPWIEHLLDMTGDDLQLTDELFRDNSRGLWCSGLLCTQDG